MSRDSDAGVSDSQSSHLSNLSIDLSQETMNQLMGAVGMSGSDGDLLTPQFQSWMDDDMEGEETPGTSTISISRAVICASNVQPSCLGPQSQYSQRLSQLTNAPLHPQLQPHPQPSCSHTHLQHSACLSHPQRSPASSGTSPSPFITPTRHGRASLLSPFSENGTITPSPPPLQIATSPPPMSFSDHPPPTIQAIPVLPSVSSVQSLSSLGSNIPQNLPSLGDYGFELIFDQDRKKPSKTATITYSTQTQRLYIKKENVVPFTFAFTKPPPMTAVIRAMAIHKQPEMIAENLVCCPKHVDELKKKGSLFPLHFIRSTSDQCIYYEDTTTKRLSVAVPCRALIEKSNAHYTTVYQFPCFTSDLPKGGQLVQIIFTLEHNTHILGRCTVDIRVCASPGRDRGNDERKSAGDVSPSADEGVTLDGGRKTRKRSRGLSSSMAEVVQCTLPPKQLCLGLSGRKVSHTITTFPEIIPYINVCINLMEQIYSVKVAAGEGGASGDALVPGTESTAQEESEVQMDLDSWLEKVNLSQYRAVLAEHGVNSLFQATEVTEKELKDWGIKNAGHRKRFMDGKDLIHVVKVEEDGCEPTEIQDGDSPPIFASPSSEPATLQTSHSTLSQSTMPLSQSSQLSQVSSFSNIPFSQSFEVLQIQVKKRVSIPDQV